MVDKMVVGSVYTSKSTCWTGPGWKCVGISDYYIYLAHVNHPSRVISIIDSSVLHFDPYSEKLKGSKTLGVYRYRPTGQIVYPGDEQWSSKHYDRIAVINVDWTEGDGIDGYVRPWP